MAAVFLVLGFVTWQAEQQGLYGSRFGIWGLTVARIAAIGGLLWFFARWLDRNEAARRDGEEQIRRSSRYFELSRDLVCTAGFDGYYKQLNAAWTQTLGWSEAELRSRPFAEFVHPDDRERTERESAGLAQGGVTVDFVNRYATKDGGWRWIDWAAMAIVEEELIYASARDVTERKVAEAALEASERRTRQILDAAGEGIFGIDAGGSVMFANPAAARMTGYATEEMTGRYLHGLLHHTRPDGSPYPAEECPMLASLVDGSVHRCDDDVYWRKDGTAFAVEYTSTPIVDGTEGAVVVFRDISDRLEVERVKDEFVSIVSHELRTPLTSIRGSLGLLESGALGPLPAKGQRMLQIAVQNTDRLVRLINDILDLERVGSGTTQLREVPCDAAELIARATEAVLSVAVDAGVTLSVDAEPTAFSADADLLIQTLTNLISNAVKFSPGDSTVHITAERRDDEIVFTVSDRGRGIPADKLESIFGRFQQVDASDSRQKGGTGLGLAICRSCVEQHGGRIWAQSELGVGSTFSFVIPAGAQAADETTPRGEAGRGPAVLVCDDDAGVVEVVGAVLEERGYRVIPARSGEVAIEQAIAERPDVILLDLLMPGMSGWQTIAALREHPETIDIPVVILSVQPRSERDTPYGAIADWIEKPPDDDLLLAAMQRAIASRVDRFTVLFVEDDPDLAEVLTAMFERLGVESFAAADGREAIELCRRVAPDLLVLDVGLPYVDGFEVVDWLRRHEHLSALPIVVYTARELDDADRERLMLGSVTQFLIKAQITPEDFERHVMTLLDQLTPSPAPETGHEPEAHSARR